jgi:ketosteroid isomerase-like protein
MATYVDATLGWDLPGWEPLKAIFTQYMPNWGPPARSYATKILAGESSALVHMVDTPELFGGELRILGAIDFADGKIVRWVDYWDSSSYDDGLYARFRTPDDSFPAEFREADGPSRADRELTATATALHRAFSDGDTPAAAALLHTDVVLVDRALRAHVIGGIETAAYLGRIMELAPYGRGSRLRHIVGGAGGGAFEWTSAGGLVGITAIERDADGLVTSITSTYDSRVLGPDAKAALVAAAFAR